MAMAPHRIFDPLFPVELADAMWRLCENFGRYGMYSEEGTSDDWGTGLPQRYDAAFNFVRVRSDGPWGAARGRRGDVGLLLVKRAKQAEPVHTPKTMPRTRGSGR